ncbi:retrotransposable element Tf2 [Tanacetum coccineum]
MKKPVKQVVSQCDICHRNKTELAAYPALLEPLPIPQKVWEDISIDFIDGLPMSSGKTMILVVVDKLSKYAHFIPMSHPYAATQVDQLILDHMSSAYHPQTDGQTKAVNKALECYLSSTKTVPFEIVYGQTPLQYVTYEAGKCRVLIKKFKKGFMSLLLILEDKDVLKRKALLAAKFISDD